jgi:chorismate synthase
MAGNTFGTIFKLTTFGESHGSHIGGIVDGCPAGLALDLEAIQQALNRRRPGQSDLVSPRKEKDLVHFVSGLFNGKTTGAPIAFFVENENSRSQDYSHLEDAFRPSHADFTYHKKYGNRDHLGGGRSSARETISRVVGGAIARQLIHFVSIQAYVSGIGPFQLSEKYKLYTEKEIEASPLRCPDKKMSDLMEEYIRSLQAAGDTTGGIITVIAQGVPIGLGEPVFDKLPAQLAKAMLSINAVKGFEIGSGFEGSHLTGSQHNDLFLADGTTQTNHAGGSLGGISNGMPLSFRVAFKPIATLLQAQEHLTKDNKIELIQGRGRHDPCVVPRAVPIVEAMAFLVLADLYLQNKAQSL